MQKGQSNLRNCIGNIAVVGWLPAISGDASNNPSHLPPLAFMLLFELSA
jgi:hypothetical protein